MSLEIGDKVIVIDEELEGVLSCIDGENITLVCDDGFEYNYKSHQVYKVNSDGSIQHEEKKSELLESGESLELIKKYKSTSSISFKGSKPVFDLHIETLAPSIKFKTDHEALLYQLSTTKEILEEARQKRVRRLILVHGVGSGVLRAEIRKMIDASYPSIEYFDGSYQHFGIGATEIIIHRFKEEH